MVFGVMVVVAKVSRTTVVAPILPIWTLSKILDISHKRIYKPSYFDSSLSWLIHQRNDYSHTSSYVAVVCKKQKLIRERNKVNLRTYTKAECDLSAHLCHTDA